MALESPFPNKLKAYFDSKSTDSEKHKFFKDLHLLIKSQQLTIAELTKRLKALTPLQRQNLFARQLYLGKPSVDSRAAQWIFTLYRGLGVPRREINLAAIVNEGIGDLHEITLNQQAINNWKARPFSPQYKKIVERELSYRLNLDLSEKTLAQAILKNNNYDKLLPALLEIKKVVPQLFLSEVITSLHQASSKKEKVLLLSKLDEIASNNPQLKQVIINAHPESALKHLDVDPNAFFYLPPSLQEVVWEQITPENLKKLTSYASQTLGDKKEFSFDNFFTRYQIEFSQSMVFDKQSNAIRIINAYLANDPNEYKRKFFEMLREDIKTNGFKAISLNGFDTNKLFAKWSGKENSEAANVVAKLYQVVNNGTPLTDRQFKAMVEGNLPVLEEPETTLKRKVEQLIKESSYTRYPYLRKMIKDKLNYEQSLFSFSDKLLAKQQQQAEAIYQQYLINKGLEMAQNNDEPIFDPQGHVIVAVKMDKNDVITQFNTAGINTEGKEIADILGHPITPTTLCNLDIKQNEPLKNKFKQMLLAHGVTDEICESFAISPERSSIIALQEELMMHIELSLRVLNKKYQEKYRGNELLNEEEKQTLMKQINNEVMEKFCTILKETSNDNYINFTLINEKLDEARKHLAPMARNLLINAVSGKDNFNEVVDDLNNHDFESTTATGLDYLRTDLDNQTVVRISHTDHTAHDKQIGHTHQALRLLARNQYDGERVQAYSHATQEARVPSLGNKTNDYNDVRDKLAHAYKMLQAKHPGHRGPLIYNLLTSVHTSMYDASFFENKNRQRKSAGEIIRASHMYNQEQLKKGNYDQLIFVQNIPVNQHTRSLDISSSDRVIAEAALMSEIALIATFSQFTALFPPTLAHTMNATHSHLQAHYIKFLEKAKLPAYFKDSIESKEVIQHLTKAKNIWAVACKNLPKTDDPHTLAVYALFKMMTDNVQGNKQFGMLMQALSVFIEPMSLAGCKSANERYQAVAGRVELLKSLKNDDFSPVKLELIEALNEYVSGKNSFENVQKALDQAYNQCNLQGSAAVFSEEDQGASSKVKRTRNKSKPGKVSELNTNYAESGYLSRLYQEFSSAMQSHKAKLADAFKELFAAKAASHSTTKI